MSALSDLSAIECNIQVLQYLAFIASYSAHQYLKRVNIVGYVGIY